MSLNSLNQRTLAGNTIKRATTIISPHVPTTNNFEFFCNALFYLEHYHNFGLDSEPPPLSPPKDKNFCKSSKTPDSWRSYQNSLSFFFLTPKYQKSNVFCLKVLSSSQNFLSLIPISYVKCPMYILQNSWQFVICQNSLSSSLTLKQLSIVFIILHNVGPYCSHNPLAVPSPLDCDLHFY